MKNKIITITLLVGIMTSLSACTFNVDADFVGSNNPEDIEEFTTDESEEPTVLEPKREEAEETTTPTSEEVEESTLEDTELKDEWWFTSGFLLDNALVQFEFTEDMKVDTDKFSYISIDMYEDETGERANTVKINGFNVTGISFDDIKNKYNQNLLLIGKEVSSEASTFNGCECTAITIEAGEEDDKMYSYQYWIPYEYNGSQFMIVVDYTIEDKVALSYGMKSRQIMENCQYVVDSISLTY